MTPRLAAIEYGLVAEGLPARTCPAARVALQRTMQTISGEYRPPSFAQAGGGGVVNAMSVVRECCPLRLSAVSSSATSSSSRRRRYETRRKGRGEVLPLMYWRQVEADQMGVLFPVSKPHIAA